MQSRFVRTLQMAAALVLFTALPALAQETGNLAGAVKDASTGQPIPGARVQAVGADGHVTASTTTDAQGAYRFAGLRAGSYTVVIEGGAEAGSQRRLDAVVSAGQTSRVDAAISGGNVLLNPLVVSASKRSEKALEAPARVEVVNEREIAARPAVTTVDHLRSVPGVDVAQTGIGSANVVARGFNNIFSGSLHALADYRLAAVPSLHVNFMQFVPSNNEDVARMEVVLGPGAALYGPNTADGILHIITKSPLDEQGTTFAVGGGSRNALQGEFRTSHLLASNFGFKLSGKYFRADDWRYTDPAEVAERAKFASNLAFYRADLMRASGISQAEADRRIALIGERDNDVLRWGGEARADWRFTGNGTAVFAAGVSSAVNGIELTGLGASQVKDWTYSYYQARANVGRLFGQVYMNRSNAGDTYLLRNGAPIVDRSNIVVAQLQHGLEMGTRQRFTYGGDATWTNPVTGGTINGAYEDHDRTREYGAYLQSETELSRHLQLVLAGRVDYHSALPDLLFSPRAALVVTPAEGHALRFTFNRAFSTPTSLNQFLDLGSPIPNDQLAGLGYSLRVQGTGDTGFHFQDGSGNYFARSPFTPVSAGGPGQLLPANSATLMPLAVGVLAARAAAAGAPLPASLVAYLSGLHPTSAQVGLNYLDAASGASGALSALNLPDIAPIRESPTNTLEAGYKGILGNRLLVAADVYWSQKQDLVTPLTIQTPLLLLNGPQLGAYLVPRFMQDLGYSQAQATALATSLIGSTTSPGLATIPVGVISSEEVHANGGQLLVTYVNVDENLDYWGSDLSLRVLLNRGWSVTGSGSWVSEDRWNTENAGLVTLNAPKTKGALALNYDDGEGSGLSGEARMRYTAGFPVNSGVYIGTKCIEGASASPLAEECVSAYTLFDLNLGYRLPVRGRRTTLQVSATNLFNESYRPFPGTPTMGRTVLARIRYDF